MSNFHQNLTQGSVGKQLIKFGLPFLVANILQAIYSMADMVVVGQFVDDITTSKGTAALNISGQIMMTVTGVIIGLAAGGTVLIAQLVGSGNMKKLSETIGTFLTAFSIIAIIVTVILYPLTDPLLKLLNTPESAFEGASDYLKISSLGIVFIFGYNALSSILRGMGDSRRPMFFVLIAAITNIALDLLFVGVLSLGVKGAAYATIAAQALSFILATIYLIKKDFVFDFKPSSFKINFPILGQLLKIGLPNGVQQGLLQSSFLVLASLINGYGEVASSISGISGKISGFAVLPGVAIMMAISSMAGQNIGAGLFDRAKETMLTGMKIVVPLISIITIVVFAFPEFFMGLFTPNLDVLNNGATFIRIASLEFLILSVLFCYNGLTIAAGYPLVTLTNTLISSLILRIPLAYLLSRGLGLGMTGIAIAMVIAPMGALLNGMRFIRSGKWKKSNIKLGDESQLEPVI